MTSYFDGYGNLSLQRWMVADQRRTDAFAAAIAEMVRPGDVVIDVGTGTGILAMLAAKAGAAQAYGVDQARVARTAMELVKANGLDDTVHIQRGLASSLEVEGGADLIVSEWLGNFAFAEGMLEDVIDVRDRLLKPGGRMLPSHVQVMLAPIDDSVLYEEEGPGFWRERIHGIDFSTLEQAELQQKRTARLQLDDLTRLAEGAQLVGLDLARMHSGDQWGEGVVNFLIERDGVVDGFAGWFAARLSPGVLLDTGPAFPWTHWTQTYLPFPPRKVSEGTTLSVRYRMHPAEECSGTVELTLGVDGEDHVYSIE